MASSLTSGGNISYRKELQLYHVFIVFLVKNRTTKGNRGRGIHVSTIFYRKRAHLLLPLPVNVLLRRATSNHISLVHRELIQTLYHLPPVASLVSLLSFAAASLQEIRKKSSCQCAQLTTAYRQIAHRRLAMIRVRLSLRTLNFSVIQNFFHVQRTWESLYF
jgi:hypothetical protein